MSEKINLEKILDKIHDENYRSSYKTWFSKQCIIDAMKEACKQSLELAAENASCNHDFDGAHGCEYSVDKQSILNTINQIK